MYSSSGLGTQPPGKFIDGHHSRQDVSSLRQLATRLGGEYHDGNTQHVSTELVEEAVGSNDEPKSAVEQLTRREAALLAVGIGAVVLALLPILLHVAGTLVATGGSPSTHCARSRRNPKAETVGSA